jgi:hypothetical protein
MAFEKCRFYRVVSSPFIIPCPKPCKWPDQVFFFSLSLFGEKEGRGGGAGSEFRCGTWKRSPLTLETKSPTSRLDRPLKIRRASHTTPFTHSLSHTTHTQWPAGQQKSADTHMSLLCISRQVSATHGTTARLTRSPFTLMQVWGGQHSKGWWVVPYMAIRKRGGAVTS